MLTVAMRRRWWRGLERYNRGIQGGLGGHLRASVEPNIEVQIGKKYHLDGTIREDIAMVLDGTIEEDIFLQY